MFVLNMESQSQGAGRVRMKLQRLRDGAAHLDELMGDTTVNFKINRHAGGAQLVGVQQAFVNQWITLGQSYPGGGPF